MPTPLQAAILSKGGGFFNGLDLDFVANRYALNGPYSAAFPAGWSFSRTGAGTAETSGGVIVPFATGVPRITSRGLLVEEARTNLIPSSNAWAGGAASHSVVGVTVAAGVAAPLSGQSGSLLTEDLTIGNHGFERTATPFTGGQPYTYSVFAKFKDVPWVMLIINDGVTQRFANFNIQTGQVGVVDAGVTARCDVFADGWYRLSISTTISAGATQLFPRVRLQRSAGNAAVLTTTYAGDGVSGANFFGSQIELGSFPTSPIITTGAAATRGADVAAVAGLAGLFPNATLLADIEVIQAPTGFQQFYATLSDGTVSNRFALLRAAGGNASYRIVTASVAASPTDLTGALSSIGVYRVGLSAAVGRGIGATNGALSLSSAPSSLPATDRVAIGTTESGAAPANAYIRRIRVLPYAASDAELQALTA